MKANGPKRKIFDAVDMLTEESSAQVQNQMADGVQMLPLEKIKAFHDHPFHLYEGERLDDMVESIKQHGVLTPVIVQKIKGGYEMLSGHNRANAAKLVGLTEIPAIVKESLTEQEAYVYVIETNMIQRSFNDLLPSEKAAVMAEQYDKTCCQGKRNDIIRELEIFSGNETESTCGHNGHKLKSRDALITFACLNRGKVSSVHFYFMGKFFLAQSGIIGSEITNSFAELFLNHLTTSDILL